MLSAILTAISRAWNRYTHVEYRKQETFDKQFLKIGQLYKGSAGSTFSRWEDDWTYYDKSNCNLALYNGRCKQRCHAREKIKSVSTGYTDPKVMAILEASPHFSEVNDGDIETRRPESDTVRIIL